MTAVLPTPSLVSASEERGAIIMSYVAAEALTVGMAVYLNSSGQVLKATALTAAGAAAIGIVVVPDNFSAETSIAIGGTALVCVFGPVWGFNGAVSGGTSLVPGNPLWVDKTTAGSMNNVIPTGAYQFAVGHAIASDTFFVDPTTGSPVSA